MIAMRQSAAISRCSSSRRALLTARVSAKKKKKMMISKKREGFESNRGDVVGVQRAITDWMDLSDVELDDDDDDDEDEDLDPCEVAEELKANGAAVEAKVFEDECKENESEQRRTKSSSSSSSSSGKEEMKKAKKKAKKKKLSLSSKSSSSSSSLLVFSGGTAMNGICDALRDYTASVTHVLPVSDDGGSTSEIIRVSGGPAVGDIRSRCLRLSDDSTLEAVAVKQLLAHRLHPTDEELAKLEWYKIQEGDSPLWEGIDNAYATIIRRFLVHFHTVVTSNTHQERFAFVNGSIGNFFFAGARMFFRSMEAAIFLYARVSKLPRETMVVPCIECEDNERVTINAELMDGTILRGQNDISHPSVDKKSFTKQFHPKDDKVPSVSSLLSKEFWTDIIESGEFPEIVGKEFWGGIPKSTDGHERVRDALLDGNLSSASELIQSRLVDLTLRPLSVWDVDKAVTATAALDHPIKRVYYATSGGSDSASNEIGEIFPRANKTMLKQLKNCDAIIYGMGSLYTSIVPNLILREVGETIARRECPKILVFNGSIDRETSNMSSTDYVSAICDALNRKHTEHELGNDISAYITHIIFPCGGEFSIDDANEKQTLYDIGFSDHKIQLVEAESMKLNKKGSKSKGNGRYVPSELVKAIENVIVSSNSSGGTSSNSSSANDVDDNKIDDDELLA
jgi:2-phospho-L-lactate transferase/gluconeogenesis factor (CofD/UPF0052 family)